MIADFDVETRRANWIICGSVSLALDRNASTEETSPIRMQIDELDKRLIRLRMRWPGKPE